MLSDNIQKYRKQKGWSQEELAVRLNVVRQTISKWERGTSVPDADMLIQLSDLLGVSVSTLLGIEEKNWRADALAEEQRTSAISSSFSVSRRSLSPSPCSSRSFPSCSSAAVRSQQ